jgi:hypothetical protein
LNHDGTGKRAYMGLQKIHFPVSNKNKIKQAKIIDDGFPE